MRRILSLSVMCFFAASFTCAAVRVIEVEDVAKPESIIKKMEVPAAFEIDLPEDFGPKFSVFETDELKGISLEGIIIEKIKMTVSDVRETTVSFRMDIQFKFEKSCAVRYFKFEGNFILNDKKALSFVTNDRRTQALSKQERTFFVQSDSTGYDEFLKAGGGKKFQLLIKRARI